MDKLHTDERRWLVFDTETTGFTLPAAAELKDQPHIIEIGIVELAVKDGGIARVVGEHAMLCDPGQQLTDEIIKITGLTDKDLRGQPTFADRIGELAVLFLGASGLVAHNLPFDLSMLINELRRCGKEHAFPYPPQQLCTVSAYHHVKGRNQKLTELYQNVMGAELKQTHRALDDARALAEIIIKEKIL